MVNLRSRLEKLEATHRPDLPMSFIRIIQDGDLTPAQEQQIADAEAASIGIILRAIVHPQT